MRSPPGAVLDLCLFNSEGYHRANLGPDQTYVRLEQVIDGRPVGALAGVLDGDVLECGWRAPFGGLDLAPGAISPAGLSDLVTALMGQAHAAGARQVRVKCRPAYGSAHEAFVQFALLSQGFAVESAELSQGVELRAVADIEAYRAALGDSAKKNLRRCLAVGLEWRRAVDAVEWAEAYGVLAENRAELGVRLKYSLNYLLAMAERFAGRVRMYALRGAKGAVAAALVYRVLPRVDYVVAWGHVPSDLPKSPMYLVAYRLVEEALADGIEVIDLGHSSLDGRVNDGLAQFKRHVGAVAALRLDLVRDLRP